MPTRSDDDLDARLARQRNKQAVEQGAGGGGLVDSIDDDIASLSGSALEVFKKRRRAISVTTQTLRDSDSSLVAGKPVGVNQYVSLDEQAPGELPSHIR